MGTGIGDMRNKCSVDDNRGNDSNGQLGLRLGLIEDSRTIRNNS